MFKFYLKIPLNSLLHLSTKKETKNFFFHLLISNLKNKKKKSDDDEKTDIRKRNINYL